MKTCIAPIGSSRSSPASQNHQSHELWLVPRCLARDIVEVIIRLPLRVQQFVVKLPREAANIKLGEHHSPKGLHRRACKIHQQVRLLLRGSRHRSSLVMGVRAHQARGQAVGGTKSRTKCAEAAFGTHAQSHA